jgi:glycosyltransferase involved in cell wall biosynthesis
MRELISIVIPVYNEAENVNPCYEALKNLSLKAPEYDFEFIFTDNASTDETPILVDRLCTADQRVKFVRYSANVGYQRSIYVGLCVASGSAVAELDCDLEDPPELILEFIALWKAGYDVVYGVRKSRAESFFKTALRKLFYRMMARISSTDLPVDAGDFRLLSQRVVEILREVPEREPYLRGLVASLGFRQIGIPYDRRPRNAGRSKFNFFGNLDLALQSVVGYSKAPMRLAIYAGFVITILCFLFAAVYLTCRIFGWIDQPGFTTLVVVILASWSTTLLFLGLIGEYIATILIETRRRPRAVIERFRNVELKTRVF